MPKPGFTNIKELLEQNPQDPFGRKAEVDRARLLRKVVGAFQKNTFACLENGLSLSVAPRDHATYTTLTSLNENRRLEFIEVRDRTLMMESAIVAPGPQL